MDLSTMQKKLDTLVYEDALQFIEDVKIMFHNCRSYNEVSGVWFKGGIFPKTKTLQTKYSSDKFLVTETKFRHSLSYESLSSKVNQQSCFQ